MSPGSLIATMHAARRLVRSRNPELLEWSRTHWEAWLDGERNSGEDRSRPRIVAAAALTCLEDLTLHIGLMQLVAARGLRFSVLLTLATEELARVARAQARREGWEMLVDLQTSLDADRLLRALPASTPLAVFPRPAILSARSIDAARLLCESSDAPECAEVDSELFLGRAARYAAWSDACDQRPDTDVSATLLQLAMQDPKQLAASERGRGRPCSKAGEVEVSTLKIQRSCVQVPRFGEKDDLTVSILGDRGESVAFVRRCGDLRGTEGRVLVRVPPTLLTTAPRKIRVEVGSADSTSTAAILPFHVPPSRLKPWMISAFLNRGGAGNPVMRAFGRGIGCRMAYAEDEPETLRDIPIVWGVLRGSDRIISRARAQDLYFFYVDHAYFNRGHGKTYRIARNAYEAGRIRLCPDDRLKALGLDVQPWRKSGREIIVCPPTEYFMHAHGCADWLETTMANLRQVTDRPIIVREKPQPDEEAVPLPQALQTAHALVTHSSNVAIEAACLGTPVFVSAASAAAPIGRTSLADIESPIWPDRQPWLAHLAYNQFSFEEIENGTAWRLMLELEDREFV